MEILSTRPFNAVPGNEIRGVYLFVLNVNYCITFILTFILCKYFKCGELCIHTYIELQPINSESFRVDLKIFCSTFNC